MEFRRLIRSQWVETPCVAIQGRSTRCCLWPVSGRPIRRGLAGSAMSKRWLMAPQAGDHLGGLGADALGEDVPRVRVALEQCLGHLLDLVQGRVGWDRRDFGV